MGWPASYSNWCCRRCSCRGARQANWAGGLQLNFSNREWRFDKWCICDSNIRRARPNGAGCRRAKHNLVCRSRAADPGIQYSTSGCFRIAGHAPRFSVVGWWVCCGCGDLVDDRHLRCCVLRGHTAEPGDGTEAGNWRNSQPDITTRTR